MSCQYHGLNSQPASKDRVVRLWQVLEDSRLDDGSPSHHAHLLRYLRERGDWMEEPERLLDAEARNEGGARLDSRLRRKHPSP